LNFTAGIDVQSFSRVKVLHLDLVQLKVDIELLLSMFCPGSSGLVQWKAVTCIELLLSMFAWISPSQQWKAGIELLLSMFCPGSSGLLQWKAGMELLLSMFAWISPS
jgi:hypothetical protein